MAYNSGCDRLASTTRTGWVIEQPCVRGLLARSSGRWVCCTLVGHVGHSFAQSACDLLGGRLCTCQSCICTRKQSTWQLLAPATKTLVLAQDAELGQASSTTMNRTRLLARYMLGCLEAWQAKSMKTHSLPPSLTSLRVTAPCCRKHRNTEHIMVLQATRGGSFTIAVAVKLFPAAHGQSVVSQLASGQLWWQHETLAGEVAVVTGCSSEGQSPSCAAFCMMRSTQTRVFAVSYAEGTNAQPG